MSRHKRQSSGRATRRFEKKREKLATRLVMKAERAEMTPEKYIASGRAIPEQASAYIEMAKELEEDVADAVQSNDA